MNEYIKDLKALTNGSPWGLRDRLDAYILQLEKDSKEAINDKSKRTDTQRKAMHLGFQLLGDRLNDMGLDMKAVLKENVSIPWTKDSIKEYIFKPIIKALFNKDSTNDLKKQGEIDKAWDVVMRHLGEKFNVEYLDFPNTTKVTKENDYLNDANNLRNTIEYPNE